MLAHVLTLVPRLPRAPMHVFTSAPCLPKAPHTSPVKDVWAHAHHRTSSTKGAHAQCLVPCLPRKPHAHFSVSPPKGACFVLPIPCMLRAPHTSPAKGNRGRSHLGPSLVKGAWAQRPAPHLPMGPAQCYPHLAYEGHPCSCSPQCLACLLSRLVACLIFCLNVCLASLGVPSALTSPATSRRSSSTPDAQTPSKAPSPHASSLPAPDSHAQLALSHWCPLTLGEGLDWSLILEFDEAHPSGFDEAFIHGFEGVFKSRV
ncbi:unnamed protein product [Ilex paraguariensis]|uniref:Uncharacterized protein n=1 Tax=Ilex paraguariensis TaxID=185542 RepID=A0ABC8T2U8_9AQUA